jgi:hypothetical protein
MDAFNPQHHPLVRKLESIFRYPARTTGCHNAITRGYQGDPGTRLASDNPAFGRGSGSQSHRATRSVWSSSVENARRKNPRRHRRGGVRIGEFFLGLHLLVFRHHLDAGAPTAEQSALSACFVLRARSFHAKVMASAGKR